MSENVKGIEDIYGSIRNKKLMDRFVWDLDSAEDVLFTNGGVYLVKSEQFQEVKRQSPSTLPPSYSFKSLKTLLLNLPPTPLKTHFKNVIDELEKWSKS